MKHVLRLFSGTIRSLRTRTTELVRRCSSVTTSVEEAKRPLAPSTRKPVVQRSAREAELGTKWEQDWQYQPNAAAMYVRQGSIVIALQSKP